MIRIAGRVESAATHFAQYGLASIIQEAAVLGVRMQWHEAVEAYATVTWAGEADPGQLVVQHAQQKTDSDSWVQQVRSPLGKPIGLFSPRVLAMAKDVLPVWAGWRREELDRVDLDDLDRRMIGALGEPAYWRWQVKDYEPDQGASRWDMADRRSGREFVKDRLQKFAGAVVTLTPHEAWEGLTGLEIRDRVGRNKDDSQTPTGFAPPQPMDAAYAWCVLWGISVTTLVPMARRMGQTAGMSPNHRTHPEGTVLPIFDGPVTVARLRALLRVPDLQAAAFGNDDETRRIAARKLASHGVRALQVFPVSVIKTPGAVDRLLRDGNLRILAEDYDG